MNVLDDFEYEENEHFPSLSLRTTLLRTTKLSAKAKPLTQKVKQIWQCRWPQDSSCREAWWVHWVGISWIADETWWCHLRSSSRWCTDLEGLIPRIQALWTYLGPKQISQMPFLKLILEDHVHLHPKDKIAKSQLNRVVKAWKEAWAMKATWIQTSYVFATAMLTHRMLHKITTTCVHRYPNQSKPCICTTQYNNTIHIQLKYSLRHPVGRKILLTRGSNWWFLAHIRGCRS